VVLNELAADAGEDGRAVGETRAVLLADAGRGAPDASAVHCDAATYRAVAPSGKLTMIARPNQIAEEKGGGKVSEKSTRKASDYAVESRATRNRSVFRPEFQL